MTTLLKATNLNKVFKKPFNREVIKDLTLDLKAGETLAIVGASGQGKSTLLHILGLLDRATSGDLEILGEKVSSYNITSLRRHIGFIFQTFHLIDDETALENILLPLKIRGQKNPEKAQRLLERFKLTHVANLPSRLLSGGEKQRVALARALITDPCLLLADEPTGNLDQENAAIVHETLFNFAKEDNKATLIVTHDPQIAARCSRSLHL